MEELRKAQSLGLLFSSGLLVLELITFRLLAALGILDLAPYLDGLGVVLLLLFALVVVNGVIAIQIVKKLGFRFDPPTSHGEKRIP